MPGWFTRYFIDPVSAWLAFAVYHGVRVLPVDFASALGGALARGIGPLLPLQRVARNNLIAAFPEKSAAEIEKILSGMWANLGRTFFEYPHLTEIIASGRVEVVGREHVRTLRDDGLPGLFWSGHLGNWEITTAGAGVEGLTMHRIFRRPNNVRIEWLFRAHRNLARGELLPKGSEGARRALVRLKKGEHLGMLVDQKMNDGIAVPFFGREAMTAPALAAFALRFSCPIVAARTVRLKGAHFRLEVHPPYTLVPTGDRQTDELRAMTEVNRLLETWIREYPEQWLWVHRRWPKTTPG
jgi:KDO2-lipid IV(A) lauroyltransferase